MTFKLTDDERNALKTRHRKERDGRIRDRIKVVLLKDKGWTYNLISEALFLDEDTVGDHFRAYEDSKKLNTENGGSESKLTAEKTKLLVAHLSEFTYPSTPEIRAYIFKTYGVSYTQQGMHDWLVRNGFSYKKPKGVPSKACPKKQAEFIDYYKGLLKSCMNKGSAEDQPILFMDSVHPTMTTKITHGWIRVGHENDKKILTTGAKSRINLTGALNLETMSMFTKDYKTVDGDSTVDFLKFLESKHQKSKKIHIILDNGSAHENEKVHEYVNSENSKIVLHFLPTYSPNLNPVERVWKVMNKYVRNNVFFEKIKDFGSAIKNFFEITWPEHCHEFVDRINDNFETIVFENPLKLFKPPPSG